MLAQIDLLRRFVVPHLFGGALDDDLTAVQEHDPGRVDEDHGHVVLGKKNCQLLLTHGHKNEGSNCINGHEEVVPVPEDIASVVLQNFSFPKAKALLRDQSTFALILVQL